TRPGGTCHRSSTAVTASRVMRRNAVRWANGHAEALKGRDHNSHPVQYRMAVNVKSMFAVARSCCGDWPAPAREAARSATLQLARPGSIGCGPDFLRVKTHFAPTACRTASIFADTSVDEGDLCGCGREASQNPSRLAP